MQDPGAPRADGGAVEGRVQAPAGRLHTHQGHAGILQVGGERADGVAPATHGGHDGVGQAARPLDDLPAGLRGDDGLEVAHDRGEGVRTGGRPQHVEGVVQLLAPLAQGHVDGVLEA